MEKAYPLNDEEVKKRFTHIGLTPSRGTSERLHGFIKRNSGLINNPKSEFHSTLRYQVEVLFFPRSEILEGIYSRLPIITPGDKCHFDIFGKDELVLVYDSGDVKNLEEYLVDEAIKQQFSLPEILDDDELEIARQYLAQRRGLVYLEAYEPHITLARKFPKENLEKLPEFEGNLVFDGFTWKY